MIYTYHIEIVSNFVFSFFFFNIFHQKRKKKSKFFSSLAFFFSCTRSSSIHKRGAIKYSQWLKFFIFMINKKKWMRIVRLYVVYVVLFTLHMTSLCTFSYFHKLLYKYILSRFFSSTPFMYGYFMSRMKFMRLRIKIRRVSYFAESVDLSAIHMHGIANNVQKHTDDMTQKQPKKQRQKKR